MIASAPRTTISAPARAHPSEQRGPALRAVLRNLAWSLFVATIVPTGLFYACLVAANLWAALIAAVVWCYLSVAWRWCTGRPTSVLLWLTVVSLTGKTVVAFATGSTLMYFLQPVLCDAAVAVAFLVSLLTTRPAVARLASEFFPLTRDVAARPRLQSLFTRLTLLWAGICASKAVITLWLLHTLSVTSFVTAKTVFAPSAVVLGAAATVALAVRVARREGLLAVHGQVLASAASA